MKTKLLLITFFVVSFQVAFAQSKNQEISFTVNGVCNMCKERIENAALRTTGVKFAEWNKEEKRITVIYNSTKTNKDSIQGSILKAGHQVENLPVDSVAYQLLPNCCKYKDGVVTH
jgi:copper chaperone CopZ